jgi:predicted ester cyclase
MVDGCRESKRPAFSGRTCFIQLLPHRGELFGTAPTGRPVRVQGIIVTRFAQGKVVEEKELYDALGMLRQLGVVTASIGKAA